MKKHRSFLIAGMLAATAMLMTGCDLDLDDDPDHKPPEGKGSIFVDNHTANDIKVFIDGVPVGEVQEFDDRAYDLPPGVYRIVLDEDGGDRTYRDDVDVLEGRLTILDVSSDPFDFDDYDVEVFFRSP